MRKAHRSWWNVLLSGCSVWTPSTDSSLRLHACIIRRDEGELAVPRNLFVAEITLHTVGEPSQIMSEEHFRSIASVMPPLERMKSWSMSYSTRVHGISLATLYRRQTFGLPSLLVVKDFGGAGGGGEGDKGWGICSSCASMRAWYAWRTCYARMPAWCA